MSETVRRINGNLFLWRIDAELAAPALAGLSDEKWPISQSSIMLKSKRCQANASTLAPNESSNLDFDLSASGIRQTEP